MAALGSELKSLFSELVELEPAARAARLEAIGQRDPELRAALAGLLDADDRADALLARLEAPGPGASDPYGLVGHTLDHFRVQEVLGAGGMGVVYRAHDLRLARDVALKLLPPHLGLDPDARRRFLREARAAATLDHPNIATVFEVGEAHGQPYHAAALYRGETLRQRLARSPLAPAEALAIARQLLGGLAHAHAAGVVHRDLKPENIILTAEGVVKIVDFGLATLPGTASSATAFAGTAAYMAPEQLRGEAVDARADLWALGVVLYEMLAGRRPFPGDSDRGRAQRVLDESPPPISSLRADVPEPLGRLVDRLLLRDPAARPASAQAVLAELDGNGPGPTGPTPARRPIRLLATPRRRWLAVGALAAILLAGSVAYLAVRRSRAADVRSIAVRPFENLSPDSLNPYIGDGIAEEVLDELGRIDGLRTVARTSSFAFRGKNVDVRAVGREMHVAAVLEGSIAGAGDRIRVWVRLVRTADGHVIWSDRYDRPLTDRLSLQDDIAGAVATALAARFRPSERAAPRHAPDQQAYNLYLEGRDLWFQRTPDALVRAAAIFERVVALDSTYALAYAGLADVYSMLGSFEYAVSPPAPAYERARAAARRALHLDPELGPAYAALANVAMNFDRDWAAAERDFERALQLDPGYAPAHQWYAFLLVAEGRQREALIHLDEAGELDPRSPLMATARAQYFYFARDYTESHRALEAALRLDPHFARAHLIYALLDMQTGQLPAAITRLSLLRAASPDDPVVAAILGCAYGRAGVLEKARALRAWLGARARQRYVPPELPAMVDIGLGQRDSALAGIEQAFHERSGGVLYLPVDPLLDPLRDDPRFQQLLRRLPR